LTESNRDKIEKYIVLFDGVCNFCNNALNFIIDRDKQGKFAFASLQSEIGMEIIEKHGLILRHKDLDSIILVKNNQVYIKSRAALEIARELDGGWPFFYLFIIIPTFVLDFFYDLLAKYRYKLFGKSETCRIPTQEVRDRFLEFVKK
jgi:predicted DCC family thiol-disulfide oxidoreductase YuxK